ncbi:hypothetical protein [Flavobacterium sp.]|uniref:hypothetical protein n=1 Tax=Flavobacterium sp. TaxID=239 RepID=UPI00374D81EA
MKNFKIILILTIATLIASCSKDDAPTATPNVLSVTTDTPTGITSTDATLGGNVVSDGGSPVTRRGICISLTINPTIDDPANDDVLEMGAGLGAFSDTFTGLPPNTTGHIRAFATNSTGTAYGEDKVFTTLGGCPIVNVTAGIAAPTTWTTGNVYVINSSVTVTSTLTIEPGVVIKLGLAGNIRVNNAGKILANGTATNRIVFTSIADDSVCGDTNGDGNATTPQKGDWLNLYLNGGNGHIFEKCDFKYAGANDGGYRCAVLISVAGASFSFDNCIFAHTASSTGFTSQFAFYGGAYMKDAAVSVFTNNIFYDNNIPIYLNGTYSLNPNNSYYNPANPAQKNAKNCIWVYPDGGNNISVNYNETEVAYVMDGYLQKSTGSMNIGPGAIMKFPQGNTYGLNVINLSLDVTAFLTSIKDDARGGDTNGDGNATAPAANDWYGYYNRNTAAWANGTNILYAQN